MASFKKDWAKTSLQTFTKYMQNQISGMKVLRIYLKILGVGKVIQFEIKAKFILASRYKCNTLLEQFLFVFVVFKISKFIFEILSIQLKASTNIIKVIKLMRLGPTNRIVDGSDSKAVDFDRRFRSNSISTPIFESTIVISI